MKNYSINEIWDPGLRPDPRKSAVILIGEEAVRKIEDAGMEFETHYWNVTREACRAILSGEKYKAFPTEASKRARAS